MSGMHSISDDFKPTVFVLASGIMALATYALKAVLSAGNVPPHLCWPAHAKYQWLAGLRGLRDQDLDLRTVLLTAHSSQAKGQESPYAITTLLEGPTVILPPSKATWIGRLPQHTASFVEQAKDQLCLEFTIFDLAIASDPLNIRTITVLMRQDGEAFIKGIVQEVCATCGEAFGCDASQWTNVNLWRFTSAAVLKSIQSMLVGRSLCKFAFLVQGETKTLMLGFPRRQNSSSSPRGRGVAPSPTHATPAAVPVPLLLSLQD
ncbi:hypothetical protein PMZ80_000067 [Knufia obscura]|uniref:Uncharacterized protein n=1 Tax=Knufia obscura TaxID=1635080 RepID=A0ABR0RZB0_9EURO|nr:hypothetical protein PMZ80_000067 [Knufia obscura]